MTRTELNVLKKLQEQRGLGDRHLLSIDAEGFTLAHTDEERQRAARGRIDLEECALHRWLSSFDRPPVAEGMWEVHWDEHNSPGFFVRVDP